MDWTKLDLFQASVIKKEVDLVFDKLEELNQPGFEGARNQLLISIQNRIQELENFYLRNQDDDRASLFEKERLRLRQAIQPYLSFISRDNRSLAASEHNDRSLSTSATGTRMNNLDRNSLTQSVKMTLKSSAISVSNRSSASQSASKKATPSVSNIYAWEDGSVKPQRKEIYLEDFCYHPSTTPGFYNRMVAEDESKDLVISDKFIDFQIVLTQEEITTLAARKKAEKPDIKLAKSQAAATSVHLSTPYVDPKRIINDMLRPGHPDRWVQPLN